MTFNHDFQAVAGVAREHQAEMLRLSGQSDGRPSRGPWLVGVTLAVVCAPLAALFFIRVW
jgi:hypothetical protein